MEAVFIAVIAFGAAILFALAIIGRTIMAQIDDLNALVAQIGTDVSGVQADVATVIALLQAVQVPGVDLTDALAKLTAVHTALSSVDASLKAVEPSAPAA